MKTDIVFPKGNEREFLDNAKRLGFEALCFVYDRLPPNEIKDENIRVLVAIKQQKKGFLWFSDNVVDINHRNLDLAYGFETSEKKNSLREIKSGLNQVVCKQAVQNGVKYGFSFNQMLNAKDRMMIFGRVRQNIKLCRKYKVGMAIASFATKPEEMRAYHDLVAFFVVLGMHPSDAKKALSAVGKF